MASGEGDSRILGYMRGVFSVVGMVSWDGESRV